MISILTTYPNILRNNCAGFQNQSYSTTAVLVTPAVIYYCSNNAAEWFIIYYFAGMDQQVFLILIRSVYSFSL